MVTNKDAAHSLYLEHSFDGLFQKVEVLHAGNVLRFIDNYGQVHPSLCNTALNMTKGYNQIYGKIEGGTIATGANGYQYFTTTLLKGIL